MNNIAKSIYCLAILTSSHYLNSMLSKPIVSIAAALKLVEQPVCLERVRPIVEQPKVKKHLKDLAREVYASDLRDEKIMGISMYDGFNEAEKEAIKYAFTQGLTRMLALWEMIGSADKNDFCRFYIPHTFFNNYPPFDAHLDYTKNLRVDLFLPVREMCLKRLAERSPSTSSHVLRYENLLADTAKGQPILDRVELYNAIEDFGERLRLTAKGIDNPCLTRMRLAARTCALHYNDRR